MGTRGVIFQTVPEEVAQAVEHLSVTYQLPPEIIIKAAVSMMTAETQRDRSRIDRFMDLVRADFEKSIDRVLV